MDWIEANLSLQYATELRVGFVQREGARLARASEDAAAAALASHVGTDGPR